MINFKNDMVRSEGDLRALLMEMVDKITQPAQEFENPIVEVANINKSNMDKVLRANISLSKEIERLTSLNINYAKLIEEKDEQIYEVVEEGKRRIADLESEVRVLEQDVDDRDDKIRDLEKEIDIKADEIADLDRRLIICYKKSF